MQYSPKGGFFLQQGYQALPNFTIIKLWNPAGIWTGDNFLEAFLYYKHLNIFI